MALAWGDVPTWVLGGIPVVATLVGWLVRRRPRPTWVFAWARGNHVVVENRGQRPINDGLVGLAEPGLALAVWVHLGTIPPGEKEERQLADFQFEVRHLSFRQDGQWWHQDANGALRRGRGLRSPHPTEYPFVPPSGADVISISFGNDDLP